MRCSDFIDQYSDYRDGTIADAFTRRRLERHLRGCARCRRYDRIIRRGVLELRRAAVAPSRRFLPALRWELATVRRNVTPSRAAWPAGLAAALLVTAVVWEGFARTSKQIEDPAPLPGRATASMPTTVDHPYATFSSLEVAMFEEDLPERERPSAPLAYPAPYRLVTYEPDAAR